MRSGRRPKGRREPLKVVSPAVGLRRPAPGSGSAPGPSARTRLTVVPAPSAPVGNRPAARGAIPGRRRPEPRNSAASGERLGGGLGRNRLPLASAPAGARPARPLSAQERRAARRGELRQRRGLLSQDAPRRNAMGLGLRSPHQLKTGSPAANPGQGKLRQRHGPASRETRREIHHETRRETERAPGNGALGNTLGNSRRRPVSRRRPPGSRAAVWKQRQQQQVRLPAQPVTPLTYILRLLIVGVGLGVIAGTVLASIDPSLRYQPTEAEKAKSAEVEAAKKPPSQELLLDREMPALTSQLKGLIDQNPGLTASVMVVDLERNSYVAINPDRRFPSASTIKLPILVALLEEVDAGRVSLTESLTMTEADIVAEAGEMQLQPPGTQFSVEKTATEMIRISDNTATNLLIKRLGGMTLLNERFRTWGLKQTALQNMLPDLGGTNTISPKDLVTLLGRVQRGDILSEAGRDRLFQILQTTETNDLLPQGIGPGATIAHKTGNIGQSIGDVGLVKMPSGKNYLMIAMVERPPGDERADELIRQMSSETYQFLESTEQQSEQMVPTNVPRSNIAGEELKLDSSVMTTDP